MQENEDGLVPLAGEVCEQYIRCGKAGCRCQAGNLHGPYYYRIWREGDRVRKVYVKAAEVETVRGACNLYRTLSQSLRDVRQHRVQISQGILKEWRRTQRLLGKSPTLR